MKSPIQKRSLLFLLVALSLPLAAEAARFKSSDAIDEQISAKLPMPVFFTVPQSAYAPLPTEINTTDQLYEYRHPGSKGAATATGLRLYVTKHSGVADRLAKSGLVQTGDLILTFRKEWGYTGPYPNVQMGVSHAGVAFVDEKGSTIKIGNIDMPLNGEYLGNLNSQHYNESSMLHIVRPRNLTSKHIQNLKGWINKLIKRASSIYPSALAFNRDYAAPNYAPGKPLEFVKKLAQIALGHVPRTALGMYCSEFAWALLSLRDCDPATTDLFKAEGVPSCIQPAMNPPKMAGNFIDAADGSGIAGYADGPLMVINALGLPEEARNAALREVFEQKVPMATLSPGHRAVAESMAPYFSKLEGYYVGIFTQSPEALQIRDGFNAEMKDNYSPTSYIVNTLLPPNHPNRVFDYVATIVFQDGPR